MKKIYIAAAIVALIIIGLLVYFYNPGKKAPQEQPQPEQSQREQSSAPVVQKGTGDIASIDDSDLRVPIDQSIVDCSVMDRLAATTSRKLGDYLISTSTDKASAPVQSLIKKYSGQTSIYLAGGDWTKTITMTDNKDKFCDLNAIRNISNIALADAKYRAENNKTAEAQAIILGVLSTNQQIEDNSGSLIGYLVSLSAKRQAIVLLLTLKSRNLIEASSFRPMLSKYFDNKVGQKRALQYEYSRQAQSIDDTAADRYDSPLLVGDGSESNLDLLAQIRKEKNSYNYEPNKLKLLFHVSFKNMYSNVDLPCGSTYAVPPRPQFDPMATTSENYIGMALSSSMLVSLDGVNNKRCEVEAKFAQF